MVHPAPDVLLAIEALKLQAHMRVRRRLRRCIQRLLKTVQLQDRLQRRGVYQGVDTQSEGAAEECSIAINHILRMLPPLPSTFSAEPDPWLQPGFNMMTNTRFNAS
mmetsp:Transcript_33107/g.68326  ORF Transcript_33107/g.68326 Transcript_33107/m.68326 type:complete len:106 (-) Transcript_33107:48-365(-)